MSAEYYADLSTTRLEMTDGSTLDFERSEWTYSGDFLLVFQDGVKSVFPLVSVKRVLYPYKP